LKILVDLHTHTVASGHAYSTISENAAAAARRGIELLGMTDHGPSMPGAPHLYHFSNLAVLPSELSGVRILRGVEANITNDEGELDIPIGLLAKLDLVLVGLHPICYPGGKSPLATTAYLKAMENPYIDIMVHPGRPDFDLDLEQVASVSTRLGIAVEINNSSLAPEKKGSWDNCRRFAHYAKSYGGWVSLGSDAHFWDRVGEFRYALELVREAGIPESQILNTSSSKVHAYLAERRQKRLRMLT